MIKLLVKLSPKLTGNQIIYRIEYVVLGSRRVGKQNVTSVLWFLLPSFVYKIEINSGKNWPVY